MEHSKKNMFRVVLYGSLYMVVVEISGKLTLILFLIANDIINLVGL